MTTDTNTAQRRSSLLRQIQLAREEMARLREALPSCFDANGKAIVATLTFPRLDGQRHG